MLVKKVIVHELIKETQKNEARNYLSKSVIPIDSKSVTLIKRLNESFANDNVSRAIFNGQANRLFPQEFEKYARNDFSEKDFFLFSCHTLNALRDEIKKVTLAKGGYFVYAYYTDDISKSGINYTGIFLVRDTEGILFSRNDQNHTFDINMINYLDTSKLAMACRIDHGSYLLKSNKYLQYTDKRKGEVSDYFRSWIAADQIISRKELTETLYEVVNQIERPLNSKTGEEYSLNDFRKMVLDNINTHPQKLVDIKSLGKSLYDDERKIVTYCRENDIPLDSEFELHSVASKKFYQINIDSDGIKLRFLRGDWENGKVQISGDNKVIIESKNFVNALRKELDEQ